MTRNSIIAVVLLIMVVGGLLLMGFIPSLDDNSSNMEIIFYDEDGNELGRADDTFSIFGIQSPSFEGNIHSLQVVVYFQVTTDIDYTLMSSKCLLSVKTSVNTLSPSRMGVIHTVAEHQLGALNTDESGTFYATYLMETLLPESKLDETKDVGWKMEFSAKVTTSVAVDRVDSRTVEDTCGTTLTLTWVADSLAVESWFGNW